MVSIPDPINSTSAAIDAAHEAISDKPRPHMGASLLGHYCERWLWLSFRWAVQEKFPGRIRRIFRRGLHEEDWIVADLKAIGADIDCRQPRVDLGCHVSGSLDGIINSGLPEALYKKHVLEAKTHSKKSFDDVLSKGVKESKLQHWVQMQVYMLGTGIDRALYYAVCKDDDRIYTERVRFDKEAAEKYVERGKRVATSDRIPPPISNDQTWYQCRFCAGHDVCFGSKLTKEVNCRTCALSTATKDGAWTCDRWKAEIPEENQLTGCDCHVLHPDLVPWKLIPGEASDEAIYEIDGKMVRNGEGDADVFSSRELIANASACAERHPLVMAVRNKLNGEIQG